MASPMGIDIFSSIKLIIWIKDNCFTEENSAQVGYKKFKTSIGCLKPLLVNIPNDFNRAATQLYRHANRDPNGASLLDSRIQAVKSCVEAFSVTLTKCEDFLRNDHSDHHRNLGQNIFDNYQWACAKLRREELQQDIQTHIQNLEMHMRPVYLQLAADTAATVDKMFEIILTRSGLVDVHELPSLSESIHEKLHAAWNEEPNRATRHTTMINVEEGVTAMKKYINQGLNIVGEDEARKTEKTLNILKIHWLVETLIKSTTLEVYEEGHHYRKEIRETKQQIAKYYQQNGYPQYDELLVLPSSSFAIHSLEESASEVSSIDPSKEGELMVELALWSSQNGDGKVSVFRVSEHILRILSPSSPHDRSQGGREVERYFDKMTDRVVPLYIIHPANDRGWRIQLEYANEAPHDIYSFQTRNIALEFQRAVTGYKVVTFSERGNGIITQRKGLPFRDVQFVLTGEVQLLKMDPIRPIVASPGSSLRDGSITSSGDKSKSAMAYQTYGNADSSLTSVHEIEEDKIVVVTELPLSPLLIAFSQEDNKYIFWKIELDSLAPEVSLNRTRLDFTASRKFSATRLSADVSYLKYWDLAAFLSNRELCLKNAEEKKYVRKDEMLGCTHLSLNFQNPETMLVFQRQLLSMLRDRAHQQISVNEIRANAKREAQSPQNTIYSRANSTRGSSTISRSPFELIPSISRASTLTIGLSSGIGN